MNFENSPSAPLSGTQDQTIAQFFAGVYRWMTLAMVVTGVAAWYAASSEFFNDFISSIPYGFLGLVVLELGVAVWLIARFERMSKFTARFAFILYSLLSGLTFSSILVAYSIDTLFKAFGVTALMFAASSIYGYTTKRDLTGFGSFLYMSLIGIIIGSVVNFFLGSPMVDWMITYGGIVVFAGLAAYDHQRLKSFALQDPDGSRNLAIYGALRLYLDFINLFIMLLRAFGRD